MTEPSIPRINCEKCGTSHHIDATTQREQGRCKECDAYLRRPTKDEEQQMAEYLVVNADPE